MPYTQKPKLMYAIFLIKHFTLKNIEEIVKQWNTLNISNETKYKQINWTHISILDIYSSHIWWDMQ